MPQKLFPLRAFVWYVVDVAYDIDRGRYDLTIREEGNPEPVVSLVDQPNAANQPRSTVDKFSFVTDPFTDRSSLTYYVDDVVIGTDVKVNQLPFVAPGRRKLFVDAWLDNQKRARARPACLPVSSIGDVGAGRDDVALMEQDGSIGLLVSALRSGRSLPRAKIASLDEPESYPARGARELAGRLRRARQGPRRAGARALRPGDRARAERHDLPPLASARARGARPLARRRPRALRRLRRLAGRRAVRAHARNGRPRAAGSRLGGFVAPEPAEHAAAELGEDIPDDLVRRLWSGEIDRDLAVELRRRAPASWEPLFHQALVAEEYFFVLLWRGDYGAARRYATEMTQRLEFLAAPRAQWLERAGDAAFLDHDARGAREAYTRALDEKADRPSVLAKLSDVALSLGDLEGERVYRERIYGSLVQRGR